MSRGSKVSSSGFGQFMASVPGRMVRVVAGSGLVAWGLWMGGPGGYALAAVGLILLAAGASDRCVITGIAEGRWTGTSVRACG